MRPLPFTTTDLKLEQLFGIPLSLVDPLTGLTITYPDSAIEQSIRAAVNTFERRLLVDLWTRKVVCRPTVTHPSYVQGPDYDIAEDPLDYSATTYYAYGYFRLRRYPIQSVQQVQLRFPESTNIFTYPTEWLRVNAKHGQVQVLAVAGAGSPAIISREGGFLPLLTGGLLQSDVPQLIYCDYTSGLDFTDAAVREEYEDLFLALKKQAAIAVLQGVGRGYKPGINSESLSEDGQSESTSYYRGKGGIFGPEIEMLTQDVEKFLTEFKGFVKGPIMTVL